jgi:hypothetical protein
MKNLFLGSGVVGIALALLLTAGVARAAVEEGGGDVPPVSGAPMGKVAVRRGVQGPEGLVTLKLLLLVDASKGHFGKPTSLAPDLFYSITDTVQIGLLHTLPMGWQTEPGAGLCLTGKSNGCPHVYDNVGFDFMYGLLYGDFHLSLHSSLYFFHLSEPLGSMWTIGLTGKLHFTDFVALYFDPQIGVELTHRDIYKDGLFIPLELQFQASSAISLKILSGVTGQLSALGDTVRSPLGVGVVANLTPHLDLGLRFSFDNLLGHQGAIPSRTDERSIGVLLNIRS